MGLQSTSHCRLQKEKNYRLREIIHDRVLVKRDLLEVVLTKIREKTRTEHLEKIRTDHSMAQVSPGIGRGRYLLPIPRTRTSQSDVGLVKAVVSLETGRGYHPLPVPGTLCQLSLLNEVKVRTKLSSTPSTWRLQFLIMRLQLWITVLPYRTL